MTDETPRISGYRQLSDDEVRVVNRIKALEREVGFAWQQVREDVNDVDRRWLAVARTHFQEGFSALVRSVARPDETSWSDNGDRGPVSR